MFNAEHIGGLKGDKEQENAQEKAKISNAIDNKGFIPGVGGTLAGVPKPDE
jgi:hypothetical protein